MTGGPGRRPGTYWSVGVEDESGFRVVTRCTYSSDYRTSMEAECAAIAEALRQAARFASDDVTVYTDCFHLASKLRSLQPIRSKKPARDRRLNRLFEEIRSLWNLLVSLGHRIIVRWVPREVMELRLGH